MNETDDNIIARVLEGDRQAYAQLVDRYKDRVFSLIMGIVRQKETAEELALDVFVKVFKSLKKFRREASFSSWLYRIAYNTAISESRKKKKYILADEEQIQRVSKYQPVDEDERELLEKRKKSLNKAMKQLQPDELLLITLYYFEEKSVEEITEVTGLSRSNTKVKLHRLRGKLRALMESSTRAAMILI
ncbi:MAG: sigma-70 family RNA polymerase sigma factor [bacterium]|jgi:RNA polymerase sigma-70 factor, ECF subfamily